MLRENLEEEAILMKDVPGWKVKSNKQNKKKSSLVVIFQCAMSNINALSLKSMWLPSTWNGAHAYTLTSVCHSGEVKK